MSLEIAVLADIHSNYVALERCMEYARERGIGRFLFLGDYIGEFAYPERTMELLRRYEGAWDCAFIRGNKENYWLGYRDAGERGWAEKSSTTGALYYAYHCLEKRDIDFFEGLPVSRTIKYGGMPPLLLCHGSPADVKGELKPEEEGTWRTREKETVSYILHGHTHIQGKTEYGGRVALNPGSVGLSLRAGGLAQFAVLHGEGGEWREELISLDYDRERVAGELRESGLAQQAPYWCMVTERLLLGADGNAGVGHAKVLSRAMELCRQDTGVCDWPDIPERYWERAVRELLTVQEE